MMQLSVAGVWTRFFWDDLGEWPWECGCAMLASDRRLWAASCILEFLSSTSDEVELAGDFLVDASGRLEAWTLDRWTSPGRSRELLVCERKKVATRPGILYEASERGSYK